MRSYRKRLFAATAMVGVLAMSGYAIAAVLGPSSGKTVQQTLKAKVSPKKLPKKKWTPGTLQVRIDTKTEAGAPRPPKMMTAAIYLDKGLKVNTKGLATCSIAKIANTDTPTARRSCKAAIVGLGKANATVAFPDQAPIPAPAGVTVFNGVPKGGKPVFLIHAYTTVPTPTTFIVPGVYENYNKKGFGYRLQFKVPRIAGGSGSLQWFEVKVGKKWKHKGKTVHYGTGKCLTGKLKLKGEFTYDVIGEDSSTIGKLSQTKEVTQRCKG